MINAANAATQNSVRSLEREWGRQIDTIRGIGRATFQQVRAGGQWKGKGEDSAHGRPVTR